MFAFVGLPGLIIILIILLIIYGPKRLPQAARGVRRGGREFKNAVTAKNEPLGELPPAATSESEPVVVRKHDTVG
jgi:sec-independent protein translocase protein TatA